MTSARQLTQRFTKNGGRKPMIRSVHKYPENYDPHADNAPLTAAQQEAVNRLTEADLHAIDAAIIANIVDNWRKVARVVGTTMNEFADQSLYPGLGDVFYAQRIRLMVEKGLIEAVGDLKRMGYSEVRLPQPTSSECAPASTDGT
ncbi:DUF3658 domain-containing protein [Paraburkholderia graminis]|uniref:DUF3658 domain-containing protein n=1 Tax=Paraburkholderia graminis TaxID=60548 RepID=UPI0038BAFB6B